MPSPTVFLHAVLLLATFTHSARKKPSFCNNRGVYDSQNRRCNCIPNWTGKKCDKKECPRGYDWFAPPHEAHEAHKGNVQCSGAGDCDEVTGVCSCKTGYIGSACEIMDCPFGFINSTTITETARCGGHGRCMSIFEASMEWNGIDEKMGWGGLVSDANVFDNVVKQHRYQKWDGNQIHGCVCDPPYTGFNCTEVQCPYGLDLSVVNDEFDLPVHNEVMRFECSATGGSFRFTFRGHTSRDIMFDAPYARVKRIIGEMASVGKIDLERMRENLKKIRID